MTTETDTPVTWADGYGIWHATVPPGAKPRQRARQAIVDQLAVREGPNFDPDAVQVEYKGTLNGWDHYVERDPT